MRQEGPFSIEISKHAEREIRKLGEFVYDRIRRTVDFIAENPFVGKKLQGVHDGFYRIKVWPYRIVYQIDSDCRRVIVLKVQHRKDVYR